MSNSTFGSASTGLRGSVKKNSVGMGLYSPRGEDRKYSTMSSGSRKFSTMSSGSKQDRKMSSMSQGDRKYSTLSNGSARNRKFSNMSDRKMSSMSAGGGHYSSRISLESIGENERFQEDMLSPSSDNSKNEFVSSTKKKSVVTVDLGGLEVE